MIIFNVAKAFNKIKHQLDKINNFAIKRIFFNIIKAINDKHTVSVILISERLKIFL